MKFGRSLARNDHFGSFFRGIRRKPRRKRSFWKLLVSNLEEASHETIILGASSLKFRRSLARNDHFGGFFSGSWKKPRTKRSFWKLFLWNLEDASHETNILEASSLKFGGSVARNHHFGSFFFGIWKKPRTKRSFWKLFLWNLEERFARNDHFGSFFSQIWKKPRMNFGSFLSKIWRKPRTKRSFWKLFLWNLEDASHETISFEASCLKFGGGLARNDHFGSFFFGIWKKPRTKRSFWKLFLWNLEEASHETIILEAFSVEFGGSLAGNDHFGSFLSQIWRKPRTKRSFCKLFLWNLEGCLARNDHFGSFLSEIWRRPRTRRSFWEGSFAKLEGSLGR